MCLLLFAGLLISTVAPPGPVKIVGSLSGEDIAALTRVHTATTRGMASATARGAWRNKNFRLLWAASTYWIYPKHTYFVVRDNGDVFAGQFFSVTESKSSGTEALYTRKDGDWTLAPGHKPVGSYSP